MELTTEKMPAGAPGVSADGTWECLTFKQGSRVPLRHCGVPPEADLVDIAGGGQLSETGDDAYVIFSAVVSPDVVVVDLGDPVTGNSLQLEPVELGDGVMAVIGRLACEGDPCAIDVDVRTAERSVSYVFELDVPFGELVPVAGS